MPLSTRIRQFIRDNIVGLLALAIALGGTAYAAAPRNSVDSRAIKNRAVKTKDLGRDAVKGSKVATGSLTGDDIGDSSLGATDLAPSVLDGFLREVPDGSVTTTKLGDQAVTTAKLGDDAVGTAQVAPDSLDAGDIATGAVGSSELGRAAVSGPAFDAAGTAALDFPVINAQTCFNQGVAVQASDIADGSLLNDVVMATPDSSFSLSFAFSVKTEASTIFYIKMCNVGAANLDPDAGGGAKSWNWIAINSG